MRKSSKRLCFFVSALALSACATPEIVYKTQIVKVPVATCPAPPTLNEPHEYVYELKSGDAPDKVMKYTEATIQELEQGVKARNSVIDSYRK